MEIFAMREKITDAGSNNARSCRKEPKGLSFT